MRIQYALALTSNVSVLSCKYYHYALLESLVVRLLTTRGVKYTTNEQGLYSSTGFWNIIGQRKSHVIGPA